MEGGEINQEILKESSPGRTSKLSKELARKGIGKINKNQREYGGTKW